MAYGIHSIHPLGAQSQLGNGRKIHMGSGPGSFEDGQTRLPVPARASRGNALEVIHASGSASELGVEGLMRHSYDYRADRRRTSPRRLRVCHLETRQRQCRLLATPFSPAYSLYVPVFDDRAVGSGPMQSKGDRRTAGRNGPAANSERGNPVPGHAPIRLAGNQQSSAERRVAGHSARSRRRKYPTGHCAGPRSRRFAAGACDLPSGWPALLAAMERRLEIHWPGLRCCRDHCARHAYPCQQAHRVCDVNPVRPR